MPQTPGCISNMWLKTVGGDAFYTYHILYHYQKKPPKNSQESTKKAQAVMLIFYRRVLYDFKIIE